MADDPDATSPPDPAHDEHVGSVILPPRPDPDTGQPFPPHGPAYSRTVKDAPGSDQDRDTTLSGKHKPPPDQGPTLVWYRASRRKAIRSAVMVFILVIVLLFVARGFATDWFHIWWIWPAMAIGSALAYPIVMKDSTAAGAEWVMNNQAWVRTYELRSVKAYTYSNSLNLHFVDKGGRTLKVNVSRLQDDRRIWDLVYNGILHSVVKGGADTNQLARGTLNLPRS